MGVDYHYLFALLTGEYGDSGKLLESISANIQANLSNIVFYFLAITILSALAGLFFGVLRWNRIEPWLNRHHVRSIQNEWFYRFPIGHDILIQIDVLSKIGSGEQTNILYRGFLAEYTVDRHGNLEDLFLTSAYRGSFNRTFVFKEIPGDILVINYGQIQNLNITYFEIEEAS